MAKKINVMMSGLSDKPDKGKMASLVAEKIITSKDLSLCRVGLAGPDTEEGAIWQSQKGDTKVYLEPPDRHEKTLLEYLDKGDLIVVDYTQPDAVNRNMELYASVGSGDVANYFGVTMGTTGGDREKLVETVRNSDILAVIDTNMSPVLVRFKTKYQLLAEKDPRAYADCYLQIWERHQPKKKDVSGTAKSMKELFESMGATTICNEEIVKVVDGIAMVRTDQDLAYLKDDVVRAIFSKVLNKEGHGYHVFRLTNRKTGEVVQESTEVEGRDGYALGTLEGIRFLPNEFGCSYGRVFSMIDVLRG